MNISALSSALDGFCFPYSPPDSPRLQEPALIAELGKETIYHTYENQHEEITP